VDSAATHPPHKKIAQKLELPLQYSSTGLAAAHSSPATSSRQDTGRELTDPELEKANQFVYYNSRILLSQS
jgi:hypothetical protein